MAFTALICKLEQYQMVVCEVIAQGVVTTMCPVLPAMMAIKNFDHRNRCLIA